MPRQASTAKDSLQNPKIVVKFSGLESHTTHLDGTVTALQYDHIVAIESSRVTAFRYTCTVLAFMQ
jgi:hypothetical protein